MSNFFVSAIIPISKVIATGCSLLKFVASFRSIMVCLWFHVGNEGYHEIRVVCSTRYFVWFLSSWKTVVLFLVMLVFWTPLNAKAINVINYSRNCLTKACNCANHDWCGIIVWKGDIARTKCLKSQSQYMYKHCPKCHQKVTRTLVVWFLLIKLAHTYSPLYTKFISPIA